VALHSFTDGKDGEEDAGGGAAADEEDEGGVGGGVCHAGKVRGGGGGGGGEGEVEITWLSPADAELLAAQAACVAVLCPSDGFERAAVRRLVEDRRSKRRRRREQAKAEPWAGVATPAANITGYAGTAAAAAAAGTTAITAAAAEAATAAATAIGIAAAATAAAAAAAAFHWTTDASPTPASQSAAAVVAAVAVAAAPSSHPRFAGSTWIAADEEGMEREEEEGDAWNLTDTRLGLETEDDGLGLSTDDEGNDLHVDGTPGSRGHSLDITCQLSAAQPLTNVLAIPLAAAPGTFDADRFDPEEQRWQATVSTESLTLKPPSP